MITLSGQSDPATKVVRMAIVSACLALWWLDVIGLTQSSAEEVTGLTARNGAAAYCMTRGTDRADAQSILVPATDIAAMQAIGFVIESCDRQFRTPEQRTAWRDEICGFAAAQSEPLQRDYERLFGERPAVLCGMAEIVVGNWDRREMTDGGTKG